MRRYAKRRRYTRRRGKSRSKRRSSGVYRAIGKVRRSVTRLRKDAQPSFISRIGVDGFHLPNQTAYTSADDGGISYVAQINNFRGADNSHNIFNTIAPTTGDAIRCRWRSLSYHMKFVNTHPTHPAIVSVYLVSPKRYTDLQTMAASATFYNTTTTDEAVTDAILATPNSYIVHNKDYILEACEANFNWSRWDVHYSKRISLEPSHDDPVTGNEEDDAMATVGDDTAYTSSAPEAAAQASAAYAANPNTNSVELKLNVGALLRKRGWCVPAYQLSVFDPAISGASRVSDNPGQWLYMIIFTNQQTGFVTGRGYVKADMWKMGKVEYNIRT